MIIPYLYNDGGRVDAGYSGKAGDCVVRAIAIATQQPYQAVYDAINSMARKPIARKGVPRELYQQYLLMKGWKWKATMKIGSGCKVHLKPEELPRGRIVAKLSKHLVAVIDGITHDTHDSTRGGTRCVYGYFYQESAL